MHYRRVLLGKSPNYSAWISRCPHRLDSLNRTLHWHSDYEFIYVIKGPLRVQKLNSEKVLNDGEADFFNSEEIHCYAGINEKIKFVAVNFLPAVVQPYLENKTTIPTYDITKCKFDKNFHRAMEYLYQLDDLDDVVESIKIRAILNHMLYVLVKYCHKPGIKFERGSDSDDFDCAKIAIEYMNERYADNIKLSDIASYVGMTPAHFSRYFKEKNEMTFTKYLRMIRLEHAVQDLCNSEISVKSAALKNGFPNVNSLIMTCKEIYGRTPLEMKQLAKS